jgi:Cu/Ag efflux pump CusA
MTAAQLIDRAIENLTHKLIEEFIVVALVCALFLWHLRSALVAIVTLPLGVLAAFLVMRSRASTPTSCRWAASPSPSARWSMRPW